MRAHIPRPSEMEGTMPRKVRKLGSGLVAVCVLMGLWVLFAPPAKSQCAPVWYGCLADYACNPELPVVSAEMIYCLDNGGYSY